ncbi:hypothetical protein RvY_07998-2 [Ramazzottius varieornatus]|nr:hypothetical protein RvY_07998-2 [Ramazzottius varieornatus]
MVKLILEMNSREWFENEWNQLMRSNGLSQWTCSPGDRYVSLGFPYPSVDRLRLEEREDCIEKNEERGEDEVIVEPDTVVEESVWRDQSEEEEDEVVQGTYASRAETVEPMDEIPHQSFSTYDRTGVVPSSVRSDATQEKHVDRENIVNAEQQVEDAVSGEREPSLSNDQVDTTQKDETIKRLKRKCDVLENMCKNLGGEENRKRLSGFRLDDVSSKVGHVLYVPQPNCPVQEDSTEKEEGECERDPDFHADVRITFSAAPARTRNW